ncbi:uncharacterized protein [Periplaneta americana]|uniref:uncharacterized protein isoform X2 n=1 Tax=Periplaneta americana TaxID=6978 RepID=UPI0037E79CE5
MDVLKRDPELDTLVVQSSNDADIKEEVTSVQCNAPNSEVKWEMKIEDSRDVITLPSIKCEPEEETIGIVTAKEEKELELVSGESERMSDRAHRTPACRQALIALVRHDGYSAAAAARRLRIPATTARRWVKDFREEGIVQRRPGSGGHFVSTPAQNAALVAEAVSDPFQTASSIKARSGFPASSRTALRRLRDAGLFPSPHFSLIDRPFPSTHTPYHQ